MANLHRGEVGFEVGGERHTLSFSANTIVELEAALGADVDAVMVRLAKGEIKLAEMRILFWLGLLDHRPDATMDDAKVLLRQIKGYDMGRLVGEAMVRALPDVPEGTAENPPGPGGPGGTGPASGAPGSALDSTRTRSGERRRAKST
jgi:hypothetical protein